MGAANKKCYPVVQGGSALPEKLASQGHRLELQRDVAELDLVGDDDPQPGKIGRAEFGDLGRGRIEKSGDKNLFKTELFLTPLKPKDGTFMLPAKGKVS